MWQAEAKWDNNCGKQRQSGIINVENRAKLGKKHEKRR
jgi:hypothetical protein